MLLYISDDLYSHVMQSRERIDFKYIIYKLKPYANVDDTYDREEEFKNVYLADWINCENKNFSLYRFFFSGVAQNLCFT